MKNVIKNLYLLYSRYDEFLTESLAHVILFPILATLVTCENEKFEKASQL